MSSVLVYISVHFRQVSFYKVPCYQVGLMYISITTWFAVPHLLLLLHHLQLFGIITYIQIQGSRIFQKPKKIHEFYKKLTLW